MSPHPSTPAGQQRGARGRLVVAGVLLAASALALGLHRLTSGAEGLAPEQRQAREQIRRLHGLLRNYYRVAGHYPQPAEAFTPLIEARLLTAVPLDPWGRPYVYRVEGGQGWVVSYGADGRVGGSGAAADVSSGGLVQGLAP